MAFQKLRWALFLSAVLVLLEGAHGKWCRDLFKNKYCIGGCCGSYARYSCCTYDVYHHVSWYYIVGGVVGGLVFLGTISSLGYFYYRHRYRPRNVVVCPHPGSGTNAGITVVHTTSTATPSYTQPQAPPYAPTGMAFGPGPGYPYPSYPPPPYATTSFSTSSYSASTISYTQASAYSPAMAFPPPYPDVGVNGKPGPSGAC